MDVTVPFLMRSSDPLLLPRPCRPAGQNARCQVLTQPWHSREGDDTRIAEAVYAARGSGPDDAFAVLKQGPHGIAERPSV